MTKLNLVILLIINLISTPNNANNKKASDLNLYLGKNIKDKNSLKDTDSLIKEIDSAHKQLKSQELRLEEIQNRIKGRR